MSGVREDLTFFDDESIPVYNLEDCSKRPLEAYFPKPGFKCKMKWKSDSELSNDWKFDGYLWRQDGGKREILSDGVKVVKYYFKSRIAQGEDVAAFTKKFNKRAYALPDHPNQILVIYDGDDSVVNTKFPRECEKKVKTRKAVLQNCTVGDRGSESS